MIYPWPFLAAAALYTGCSFFPWRAHRKGADVFMAVGYLTAYAVLRWR